MRANLQTYDTVNSNIQMQSYYSVEYFELPEKGVSVEKSQTIDTSSFNLPTKTALAPPPSSLFTGHQLKVVNQKEEALHLGNQDWIIIHLIGVLFILAWVRLRFGKRFKQFIASFASNRYQGMLSKEGNILREQISLGLMIVYLIVTSLFFYVIRIRILVSNEIGLRGFQEFSIIFLAVLAYWFLKSIGITLIGHIFKNPVLLKEYILTNFIFNVVLAIGLIPLLLIIVYVPSQAVLNLSIALFLSGHIYRVVRQMFTALSYPNFSYLNRILYLCTFEIAPVLVLIKLVIRGLA